MAQVKKIMIGFLAVSILLVFLQSGWQLVPMRPLGGVTHQKTWPGLSLRTLDNLKFQDYLTHQSVYKLGFREFFIRLNNQLYYSLYRKSPEPNLVIGKDNYLFERQYIESYFGEDFISEMAIDSVFLKLDTVSRFLEKFNTRMVFVLAPNKAACYADHIPDYLFREKLPSNYDYFIEKFRERDYDVLDVNGWFVKARAHAEYPLFTSTGIHWSSYGAMLVADSLLERVGQALGREMYRFVYDSLIYPRPPRGADRDLEQLANIFSVSHDSSYAYPAQFVNIPNADGYKPRMIVIGDSFFWGIYHGYFTSCFREVYYWYYFHSIFPKLNGKITTTEETDVARQAAEKDVVVILTSVDNLTNFGFGFIDYMYEYLMMDADQKYEHLIPRYVRSINNNPELLELIAQKARDKQISLDSMIYLDATWLANRHLEDFYGEAGK